MTNRAPWSSGLQAGVPDAGGCRADEHRDIDMAARRG